SYRPVISSPNAAFPGVTVSDWQYHAKANNVLLFEIQNASPGDQIAITVNRLGGLLFDQVVSSPPPGSLPDLTGYTLTFSEEFDGPLDVSPFGPGTKWIAHTPYGGDFGDAEFVYSPEYNPFSIENGVLAIRAWNNGKWRSGLLASVDTQGNGFSQ